MTKKDDKNINTIHFEIIIRKGCELLMVTKIYGQSNIVNKLTVLNYKISKAWLSSFLNGTRQGKPNMMNKISEGIKYLVEQELGYIYQYDLQEYSKNPEPNWQANILPESEQEVNMLQLVKFHYDGRVSVQYKTDFFADAKHEVIQLGVRLNTFSSYFTSQSDKMYKAHIIKLLERGVNVKGYLLDPDSNEARIYFLDRTNAQSKENDAHAEMKRVKENLRSLVREFSQMGLKGKFEIYEYKHIPYGNFFVVDGAEPDGKMMVANYIYGIRRAESPVWEFSKKANPPLYRKYWESVQKFIEGAVKLE